MPNYVLRVRERFEAAHQLRTYRGGPEPVHGHSWQVEAVLRAHELDEDGLGFDFLEIKAALKELAARFHHNDVNTVPPFDELTPSTEHLARYFFTELSDRLPAAGVAEVTVWEGPDCSAAYSP